MKIALLGDAHIGARSDSLAFHSFFRKFYGFFFSELKSRKIDTIIQLGDLWDRRKYINFVSLSESRKYFFDELRERDISMTTILGNHDITFKNTLEVNASSLLLQEYDNITVIDKPTTVELGGIKIALIPWICSENYVDCFNEINNTQAEICMGHFEISGFEMYRGHIAEGGLNSDSFNRFDTVFSGHYHHRSTRGNISYLGTPYELTWQDYNDPRGFHIFDTETLTVEFIQNPFTMFVRLEYNDKHEVLDLDAIDLTETYVKLVVVNKTDYYKYDNFINKLYTKGCHDIKIVEDMSEFQSGTVDETIDLEDTLSILSNYVDSINTDIDKDKIKTYMKSLYIDALNCEVV